MSNDSRVRTADSSRGSLETVQRYFGRLRPETSGQVPYIEEFAEGVVYEISIAEPTPRSASFRGRETVEIYLSLVLTGYNILSQDALRFIAEGNHVVVQGSEIAYLTQRRQVVQTAWVARVEVAEGRITRVVMSVYEWTLLATVPASNQPVPSSLHPH